MKEKITHVRRDAHGRVVEVKTNNNNIYDIEVAKEYVINNQIENANVDLNVLTGMSIINSIDNNDFLGFPEF